jgi:FAD/FMN-containing dehydrogenase
MLPILHPSITFDFSLNIGGMDDYLREVKARLSERFPRAHSVFFGHIGDGNVHPAMTVGSSDHDGAQQVEEIVYGALRSSEGIISAEHGIGLEKKPFLSLCCSAEEMQLMHTLKHAPDPDNLLNPGKIFDLTEA